MHVATLIKHEIAACQLKDCLSSYYIRAKDNYPKLENKMANM